MSEMLGRGIISPQYKAEELVEPDTAAKHRQPRFMDTHAMHMVPCRKGWQAGGIWVGLAEHRMQANVVHLRCSIACMLSQEVLLWHTMLLTSAPALCFYPKPDHSSCCQTTAPIDPAQVVTFASRAKSSPHSHKCPGCASITFQIQLSQQGISGPADGYLRRSDCYRQAMLSETAASR